MPEEIFDETPVSEDLESSSASRERSTIKFPYMDLEAALALPTILGRDWGGVAMADQLASGSGHSSHRSGAFIRKIAAAQAYGLLERANTDLKITAIGLRVLDPETRESGLVDAFLYVELFSKAFNEYRGKSLPSDKGLENVFQRWGVAQKQTTVARQVFKKSARFAGFFLNGESMLVLPKMATPNVNGKPTPENPADPPINTNPGVDVAGLVAELREEIRGALLSSMNSDDELLSNLPSVVRGALTTLPLGENAQWTNDDFEDFMHLMKLAVKQAFKSKLIAEPKSTD